MSDFNELDSATFSTGQVGPAAFASLQDQGFACVVCHRPDGEEPDQPTAESLRQAADAAGLRFVHLPVSGLPHAAAVAGTREVLESVKPGEKVLMFCRSGMRSTAAWAMARAAMGDDPEDLRDAAARAGYDLSRVPL